MSVQGIVERLTNARYHYYYYCCCCCCVVSIIIIIVAVVLLVLLSLLLLLSASSLSSSFTLFSDHFLLPCDVLLTLQVARGLAHSIAKHPHLVHVARRRDGDAEQRHCNTYVTNASLATRNTSSHEQPQPSTFTV